LPKHVSDTILFLISDDSSYMTGEIINLDAAYSLNIYNTFGDKNEYD
jgi:enoyl-[acyl-carrier-protein] reductase (NADH)